MKFDTKSIYKINDMSIIFFPFFCSNLLRVELCLDQYGLMHTHYGYTIVNIDNILGWVDKKNEN